MFRQQIARQARLFSTTPVARKSPVEVIKDAAKAVDKTISGAAVKGIEKGEHDDIIRFAGITLTMMNEQGLIQHVTAEQVAEKVKEVTPETTGQAKGQANEMAGQVKGKANEVAGEAKGKAAEVKGEAKSKM
ncbi:hypothetical protein A1F97_04386 [Pyrenophora tritici-repentis]|nr:hypothetical protein A1F97_04386 [Pyrenophora tritici-repentis]